MTDQTAPSRRAGLRDEIAAALEAADYRMDMRRGDLADAVLPVLYREWPWLRAEAEDTAVPPVDQAALRDRIAHALITRIKQSVIPEPWRPGQIGSIFAATEFDLADAVLAVLPEPADRVAVLREAADDCDEAGGKYASRALNEHAAAAFDLMEYFQRKANEVEYAATLCDFAACEPGGEPCSTHERLMAHAEGDHELCAPDCGTPDTELRRMADEAQPAEDPKPGIQLPYTHTDDDSDQFLIGVVNASTHEGDVPQVFVCARQFSDDSKEETTVYVRPEAVEPVVTALRAARAEADRMASEAQQGEGA